MTGEETHERLKVAFRPSRCRFRPRSLLPVPVILCRIRSVHTACVLALPLSLQRLFLEEGSDMWMPEDCCPRLRSERSLQSLTRIAQREPRASDQKNCASNRDLRKGLPTRGVRLTGICLDIPGLLLHASDVSLCIPFEVTIENLARLLRLFFILPFGACFPVLIKGMHVDAVTFVSDGSEASL